ncbi:MAG: type II toxin-antitoxin system Phd/YefM family antitoxin [Chloroflexia bacterium]|jgi:prevent-host-death family protein|nr:type II toxin-antitoxin system Phd/YefM family antitoxin [Chloroflexia bacterium]
MTTTTSVELRENLHDILLRTQYEHERVTVTRHGKPVAAIVPLEDLEWLQELEDRIDQAEAEIAYREMEEHPPIPLDEVKRLLYL